MSMLDISPAEVSRRADQFQLPLAFLGGLFGTTEKYAAYHAANNQPYPLSLRVSDAIASWTGYQVTIGGNQSGISNGPIFSLTGIFNKGMAALIMLELYKAFGLPYSNMVSAVGEPIAAGYMIGGLFDPAPTGAPGSHVETRNGRQVLVGPDYVANGVVPRERASGNGGGLFGGGGGRNYVPPMVRPPGGSRVVVSQASSNQQGGGFGTQFRYPQSTSRITPYMRSEDIQSAQLGGGGRYSTQPQSRTAPSYY
jgi:hypothetical protein